MSTHGALQRECRMFARYLCGVDANDYVVGKYAAAHGGRMAFSPCSRFDRWLLTVTLHVPWLTRPADSFSRLLVPDSALRRKLLLLLAILETSPGFHEFAAGPGPSASTFVVSVRLVAYGISGAVVALLGVAVFLPLYVFAAVADGIT